MLSKSSKVKGIERSSRSPSKFFNRSPPKEQEPYERTMTESMQKMETIQNFCSDLRSSLNNYLDKFQELHEAKEELSRCFLQVYKGTKEQFKSVAFAYSSEVKVSKNKRLPRLKSKIEKFLKDLEDYRFNMSVSNDSLEERKTLLSSFNHYNMKCAGLKAKQDKCRDSGKTETVKQKEKVGRNQEKFEQAKSAFFKKHQIVIDELNQRWKSRFLFFNRVMGNVLNNEFTYFESICKGFKTPKLLMAEVKKVKNVSLVEQHSTVKVTRDSHDEESNFEDAVYQTPASTTINHGEDISSSRKKPTSSCRKSQSINNEELTSFQKSKQETNEIFDLLKETPSK